jgi:hypothetical protein
MMRELDASSQIRKNKIDLEHANLLETRNAIYLVESGFLVGLTTWVQFLSGLLPALRPVAILTIVLLFVFADSFRSRYDYRIEQKEHELDELFAALQS